MQADAISHARIVDDIEAAAFRDMYATVPNELVSKLNPQSVEIAGATLLMASGIPDPTFNRVIGLGNSGEISDTQIDGVVAAYRDAGIGSYWLHVNTVAAPSSLPLQLEQRGYQLAKRRTWAKMIRGTEPTTPIDTALTIRLARSDEYAAVGQAITNAFGMPPLFAVWIQNMAATSKWTLVAALDNERIVGGGLVFIENQLAWLGMGGVIPEARGRQAHRAIMTQRINIAIERDCTHIVTETGEPINNEPNPSLRNMYRCGFTRVCARLNYVVKREA
jgi:hypothetical protein